MSSRSNQEKGTPFSSVVMLDPYFREEGPGTCIAISKMNEQFVNCIQFPHLHFLAHVSQHIHK